MNNSNTTIPTLGNDTSSFNNTAPISSDAALEPHPYLEFFICLIPVYVFIIVAAYKIVLLMDNSLYIIKSTHLSYLMKRRISLVLVALYVAQFFLALVQSKEENWTAGYKGLSLLYLFGAGAWYLSAKLLELEAPRGLPQGLLSHRLFWVAQFLGDCIGITSPFSSMIWVFLINIPKLLLGLVLALYAIGKPYDSVDMETAYSAPNGPKWVRDALSRIENIFFDSSNKETIEDPKETPLLPTYSRKNTEHEDYVNEFKGFIKQKHPSITHLGSFKETSRSSSRFRPHLQVPIVPEIHCKITKNEVREKGDDEIKIYYEVKTQIEDQSYTKLHKYANFLDLQEYIERHCSSVKLPYFPANPPKLAKVDFDGFDDEESFLNARVKKIEEYMSEIVGNPCYMNDRVLDFLGIQNDHRDSFTIYQAFLKKNSSKSRALHYFKPHLAPELTEAQEKDNLMVNKGPKMPLFTAYCSHYQKSPIPSGGDNYEYVFVLKDENDPYGQTWEIVKNYSEFKAFHKELEGVMKNNIPFFDQLVPKETGQSQNTDTDFLNKRKIALEKYLDLILEHRRYYKAILYEFLDFHNRDNQSSRSNTPRDSFYGEMA